MQPHSMCALAFAKFYWNQYDPIIIKGDVKMRVEYQLGTGEYKTNEYRLSNIQESSNQLELKVYVIRSSGGISCEITIRRNSRSEGAELTMTHSQQHVSGLREVYQLMKKRISDGRHYNSEKYGRYEGESDDPKKLVLYCEVKNGRGDLIRIPYTLEITSVDYVLKKFEKSIPKPEAPKKVVVTPKEIKIDNEPTTELDVKSPTPLAATILAIIVAALVLTFFFFFR